MLLKLVDKKKMARTWMWQGVGLKCKYVTTRINRKYVSAENVNFSKAKFGDFIQDKPQLGNQYLTDTFLRKYLKQRVSSRVLKCFEADLIKFGGSVAGEIHSLGLECERNPPRLIQQNAWGERVDELWTCDAWKKMKDISAEEGLISIAYDKKFDEFSRLYQMVKVYLFVPSSGLFSCPLAMTDGAAETIEKLSQTDHEIFGNAYRHLISRDPKTFWTSGQWMTEKKGGSDVANGTETTAVEQEDGSYLLRGYKFFSSASDSDMSLTLARIVDQNGQIVRGTKGLTLFYLQTKNGDGRLNGLQMVRLKDKLGTRQLPTAELLLDGTVASKLSDVGRGVSAISTMLSLTRLHNSCNAVSAMRRILNLAVDYSHRRVAFGQPICKYPLHVQTLARMELETRGVMILFLEAATLLGKIDCHKANDREQLIFRLITPILKLYSAKQAVKTVSEGLECFGGQGYMEDTGLPIAFRDSQVLPIWEGTTNILSLDVIRSISKTNGAVMQALAEDVTLKLEKCSILTLESAKFSVQRAANDIGKFVLENPDKLLVAARDLAFSIARTYVGALLIENASISLLPEDATTAKRWCSDGQLSVVGECNERSVYDKSEIENDYKLVMDGYNSVKTQL